MSTRVSVRGAIRKCERCGGSLVYDLADDCLKCIMCCRPSSQGHVQASTSEVTLPRLDVQRKAYTYFNEHCDEILADRLTLGHKLALDKWGISSGVWLTLKPRWIRKGVVIRDLRGSAKK